jgi:LiaF transmembrane domain/Cell wall-active antibiotics response LiaF, C-terminal
MSFESPRRQRHTRERGPAGSIILGLLIATFGLTLLANNLGWADVHAFMRRFWPILLMVAGAALLLVRTRGQHSGSGFWGSALILGGLWAYADQRDWIHVSFWAVFGPTLLVLLGASFVWRAFNHPRPDAPTDAYVHAFSIMSGNELKPSGKPFQGADLAALMGGVALDLTGAQMEGDTVTIDVFAVMGGIEIFVPRDWDVTTKVIAFMGACVDKRRPAAQPATKTLVVRGFALMGGIDIKD